MKGNTLFLSILLLCYCVCCASSQQNNIFSTWFEISPLKTLKSKIQFPIIIGQGVTIFLNSLSYLQVFEENMHYGFGLTYTIGELFPIPYFNFKFTITNNIRLYGVLPKNIYLGFLTHEKLELALKAEMISFSYTGNNEKYTVENPLISLINIWCGACVTVNLFEYFFFGIEGGYSVYRSANLIQTDDIKSSELENALILRCFFF